MPQELEEDDQRHSKDNQEHSDRARRPPGAASTHSPAAFNKVSRGRETYDCEAAQLPLCGGEEALYVDGCFESSCCVKPDID